MYDICERLRSTPRADIREVMREAADEIERLRLTDAEREVLGHEVELAEYQQRHDLVATLRGLLERIDATGSGESHE